MSLRDEALYTLTFIPSGDSMIKLCENTTRAYSGDERYVRTLENKSGEEYSSALYDPLSGARLASTGYVSEKSRSRRLELHGPDVLLSFEDTGKLGFEWTFTFEDNKFKWKKSSGAISKDLACVMKRGGDPDVEICLFRPAKDDRRAQFQLLTYNLERFINSEIKDARGLETVLVMTAVNLQDAITFKAGRKGGPAAVPAPTAAPVPPPKSTKPVPAPIVAPQPSRPINNGGPSPNAPQRRPEPQQPPPPQEVLPSQQMVQMLQQEEDGEVLVGVNTDIEEHVHRANRLLFDENVLFIIIKSCQPEAAARAAEVSLGVQRYRHRNMLPELHRYMVEEEESAPKGPRVINLDDPPAKPQWKPPPRLNIYLSRIALPDLVPKAPKATPKPPKSPAVPISQPSSGSGPVPGFGPGSTTSSSKPPNKPSSKPSTSGKPPSVPTQNRPPPVTQNRPPTVTQSRPPPVTQNRPPVTNNQPPPSNGHLQAQWGSNPPQLPPRVPSPAPPAHPQSQYQQQQSPFQPQQPYQGYQPSHGQPPYQGYQPSHPQPPYQQQQYGQQPPYQQQPYQQQQQQQQQQPQHDSLFSLFKPLFK